MSRINLSPPSGDVIDLFELACKELGVRVHRAEDGDDMRWHLTIPKQKGTLDAFWSPTNQILFLDLKPHKRGDWMPPVIEALKQKF